MRRIMFTMLLILMILFVQRASVRAITLEDQSMPPALKAAYEYLKSKRHLEALKKLEGAYKYDPAFLWQYHYVYASASDGINNPMEAIDHMRLAYLYAPVSDVKEQILIERANLYFKINYFYEAKAMYRIFLDKYPDSKHVADANLGIARSLSGIGLVSESLEYYKKSGEVPDALFGIANSLQRLGRINEAHDMYSDAVSKDGSYMKKSDETNYYFGENLRQLGIFSDAKKYLSTIKDPLFKYKADASLGMIAIAEDRPDQAIKRFKSALISTDRSVKRLALLNLADIDEKAERLNEAKASLEEIRYKYPYGNDYDDAIIRLSKIYEKEGDLNKAVSILKELVFRLYPHREATDQFEKILASTDSDRFIDIWKSVGSWLVDASRERFLLGSADKLRNSATSFIKVFQYLAKHGSETGKLKSCILLATFYAELGDTVKGNEYLGRIKAMKGAGDDVLRIEAMLAYAEKNPALAYEKMLSIKHLQAGDIKILEDTLMSAKDFKKAVARYESVLNATEPDAAANIYIADIHYNAGNKKEAVNYYKKTLEIDPGNEWALYRMSKLLDSQSDTQEAESMLKTIKRSGSAISGIADAILREKEISKSLGGIF